MKKQLLYCLVLLSCSICNSQSLLGAWEGTLNTNGKALRNVVIISETHQVATFYDAETGSFVSTNGGNWNLKGNMLSETVEFDSENPERVGTTSIFQIELRSKCI